MMHRKGAKRIHMNDSVPSENETSMTPMNDNSDGDANDSCNAYTLYNQASQTPLHNSTPEHYSSESYSSPGMSQQQYQEKSDSDAFIYSAHESDDSSDYTPENKMLPNQVENIATSSGGQATAANNNIQEGLKEQVVEENDNLSYRKNNSERRKLSKRSEPGCSKESDADTSLKEEGFYDIYKLQKDSKLMHALLPKLSYELILLTHYKNQFARNCIELTLWDLLPVDRPLRQPLKRRKDSDEICVIEHKKSPDTCLGKKQVHTKGATKKKGKAYGRDEVVADNRKSEDKAFASSMDELDGMEKNVSEQAASNSANNDTNQESAIPMKKTKIRDEPIVLLKDDSSTIILPNSNTLVSPEIDSKAKEVQSTKNLKFKKKRELSPENNRFPILQLTKLTLQSNIMPALQKDESCTKPTTPLLSPKLIFVDRSAISSTNSFSTQFPTTSTATVPNIISSVMETKPNEPIVFPSAPGPSSPMFYPVAKPLKVYSNNKMKQNKPIAYTLSDPSPSLPRPDGTLLKASSNEEIILNEEATKFYVKLIPMFPCVKTHFIKQLCHTYIRDDGESPMNEEVLLEYLVETLLNCEQVNISGEKTEPLPETTDANPVYDMNEQYADLLRIFPQADPAYLRKVAEEIYSDPKLIKEFVQSKLENDDHLTRAQYLAKEEITEQQKQYTTNFQVQQFLELFPDPFLHFENDKRECEFNPHAVNFLKFHFSKLKKDTLLMKYTENFFNLSLTAKALEALKPDMKTKRFCNNTLTLTEDIPFLQECAFIQHKAELRKYMDDVKTKEKQEFNKFKARNLLLKCQYCYDNECVPSKCCACKKGHIFCYSCIVLSTDIVLEDGNTRVDCLLRCGCEFPISVLQLVLPPTKFSILLCKRQEAEVLAAELEGLVSCPFCHFAAIPPPEDKIFKCLNPKCWKESCRLCKKLNHIPLKCIEKISESARLYSEEKMSQALVRKCYRCNRIFFKEKGCNKMTCVCGAQMCYICDKPVTDYKHFQDQRAESSNRCPLWM